MGLFKFFLLIVVMLTFYTASMAVVAIMSPQIPGESVADNAAATEPQTPGCNAGAPEAEKDNCKGNSL